MAPGSAFLISEEDLAESIKKHDRPTENRREQPKTNQKEADDFRAALHHMPRKGRASS